MYLSWPNFSIHKISILLRCLIHYKISNFIPEKTGLLWRIKRWSNQMESQLWMLLCMELENMPPFEFPNPGGDRITWDEANTQNDTYFPILQNIYYRQIEIYDVNLSRKYWRRLGNRKYLVFSFIYNKISSFTDLKKRHFHGIPLSSMFNSWSQKAV